MNEIKESINLKSWKLVNFCEFDKYATKSYCAIHGVDESLNLGDITKVDENNISDFNMMTWGFPCTDVSCAGKQKGFLDENGQKTRSGMYYEGIRILRAKKPALSIIENVKNLTGKKFKIEFEMVLRDLDESGYNSYYKVLNAKNYGTPQNRERVFIISIRKDLDNGQFKFPEPFDNGIRLKDILEDEVDEKFYISDDKVQKFLSNCNIDKNKIKEPRIVNSTDKQQMLDDVNDNKDKVTTRMSDIASCLRSTYYKNGSRNMLENMKNGNGYEGIIEANCVKQLGNISESENGWSNPQTGRIYSPNGVSPTLNTCGGGQREPKILQVGKLNSSQDGVVVSPEGISKTHTAGHNNMPKIIQKPRGFNKGGLHDICPTLSSHSWECNNFVGEGISEQADGVYTNTSPAFTRKPLKDLNRTIKADSHPVGVYNGVRIRKLTPKETFRLMGFSDKDFCAAKDVGISNSQLYKQSGNSIVVDVLYYTFIELYKAMPYLFDDLKLSSFFSGIGAFECALDRLYESINTGNFIQPQVE